MLSLVFRSATVKDIPQIQDLQARYHVATISDNDKVDGFVTTLFTPEQFEALIREENGLTIALDGERVVGYVMAASWHYWQAWPLFQYMISDLRTMNYLGETLTVENSYQYGPICIDKAYRGSEVLLELFDYSRKLMAQRFRILVTFINHINPRSYTAHVDKLGLEVLKSFSFNDNQYYCLAYDTQRPVTVVRRERPEDWEASERVTREAFWNHHGPGCDEHFLLNQLRKHEDFIADLDYVATIEGQVVGQITYTKGFVQSDNGIQHTVICFGPLSVLPEYQGRGIGSKLVQHSLSRARALGYRAVLIYGDPEYYQRFGFVGAESFDIGTPGNYYADPLQALPLEEGALSGICGRFYESAAFQIDPAAAKSFDTMFTEKERLSGLPSQQHFQQLLLRKRPRGGITHEPN